jgi:hypothetical protein
VETSHFFGLYLLPASGRYLGVVPSGLRFVIRTLVGGSCSS